MKPKAVGKWYKRIWIYLDTPDGKVRAPFVLLAEGRPGYVINQWIYWMIIQKSTLSSLRQNIRALEYLYAFTMARYESKNLSKADIESLLAGFIDAMRYGTDSHCETNFPHLQYVRTLGLDWKRATDDNIERYISAINIFDEWQAIFHGAERMNPSEKRFMDSWEIHKDFQRRTGWDPLLHLHPSRTHEQEENKTTVKPRFQHSRHNSAPQQTAKAFPMKDFLKLFDCACNPRDQLLLLEMAGGSLRMVEPLHHYRQDIEGFNEYGELKVRLEDPVRGLIEWNDGKVMRIGRRDVYLSKQWKNTHLPIDHALRNLKPRDTYLGEALQAGWKGMSFGESSGGNVLGNDPLERYYDVHYLWWIDPRVGARAHQAYVEYRDNYLLRNYHTGKPMPANWLNHPWLYINIESDGYGNPLTYAALKQIWIRLLDRLAERYGIDYRNRRLGFHSLRHLFGWYCASVLGLSIEDTSLLMHHASKEATAVYYKISPEVVRNKLQNGFLKNIGYSENEHDLIVLPGTPKLTFPESWMPTQLRRTLPFRGKR